MTPEQRRARVRGRAVAWILLITMGITTIVLNIDHAVATGDLALLFAVLVAMVPVIAYVGLSEIVAVFRGRVLQTLTILSMAGGMALSITAIAAVVRPEAGPYLCWLFGFVLDLPVVISLYVIMNEPADGRAAPVAAEEPLAAPGAADPPADLVAPVRGPTEEPGEEPQPGAPEEPAAGTPGEPAGEPRPGATEEPDQEPAAFARDTDAVRARAVYRKSLTEGKPLTDRALATALFGDAKRRKWAAGRISEVNNGPQFAQTQAQ
jgi:hypothetical protein